MAELKDAPIFRYGSKHSVLIYCKFDSCFFSLAYLIINL